MKNTTWIYLSTSATNLLCLLFGMISGILSARLLGPHGRGELAIIAYFPSLMGTFCCLAIPQAISFFIPRESERTKEIAAAGFRLALGLGLVGAIGFALAAPYTLTDNNRHLAWAVTVACLAAPALVVTPHMIGIYQGMYRFNWVNSMQLMVSVGYVLCIFWFWWLNHISALSFVLATLSLQILASLIFAWRLGLKSLLSPVPWKTYRPIVVQGLKFFMPVAAMTLFAMSDRAILIRTTSLEQIGYYSVAFSLTYPLVICASSFIQVGFVEMAGTLDMLGSASLMTRRFHMAQVVVVGASVMLLALADPVIRYGFGPKFLPALPATYLMACAMSLGALNAVLENNLRAKDMAWPGVCTGLIGMVFLIILGCLWTPKGGAAGFSLAFLCSEGVGSAILIFIVCRVLSISLRDLWGLRPRILSEFVRTFWHFCFVREAQR
jgi:O-antigen/teichoic acid export membrane protein